MSKYGKKCCGCDIKYNKVNTKRWGKIYKKENKVYLYALEKGLLDYTENDLFCAICERKYRLIMNNVPEDRKRKIVNANYINKKSKKIDDNDDNDDDDDDDDDESKNLNRSISNPKIIEEVEVIKDTFLNPADRKSVV